MPAMPLQSVRRAAKFELDPRALSENPELAVLIARAIAEWARVEAQLGLVLVIMTGAKAKPVAAMYGSLKSPQARADTVRAVGRAVLSKEASRTLDAVLKHVRSGADLRNRLAHGIWGASSEIPNALLVIDADVRLARQRELTDLLYDSSAKTGDWLNAPKIHSKDVFVYFKPDLEDAIKVMEECYGYVQALCTLVAPESVIDPLSKRAFCAASDRIHNWLRSRHPLQKYLKASNHHPSGS